MRALRSVGTLGCCNVSKNDLALNFTNRPIQWPCSLPFDNYICFQFATNALARSETAHKNSVIFCSVSLCAIPERPKALLNLHYS